MAQREISTAARRIVRNLNARKRPHFTVYFDADGHEVAAKYGQNCDLNPYPEYHIARITGGSRGFVHTTLAEVQNELDAIAETAGTDVAPDELLEHRAWRAENERSAQTVADELADIRRIRQAVQADQQAEYARWDELDRANDAAEAAAERAGIIL
jgi:hypothetical protein